MGFIPGVRSAAVRFDLESLLSLLSPPLRTTLKHVVTRLLAGGILFFAVFTAHATAPIGATAGSFGVSPSGAATYSIPIVIPPGTNGMQPQLSLNYNSQGGNGLVGTGWSLGGLSVIHRCGATIALDGAKGGVNYDTNDKLCLDGERLIPIGNNEYRTQHESWQKIVAWVPVGSPGPTSFTVWSKDGTISEYGSSGDSRVEAQGQINVRVWALNKITDRNGNYLTISYQEDNPNGDHRPDRIDYTGNGSSQPYNSVIFGYVEPQASRLDIPPLYEGGSIIKTQKRLTHIYTYAGAALVREYRLTYNNNGAVDRSRLSSIKECDSDGVCLPATQFIWSDAVNGYQTTLWQDHGGVFNGHQWTLGDFNGDGNADLIVANPNNDYWVTGTGFASPVLAVDHGGPLEGHQWLLGDFNGDGKTDLIVANPNNDYYVSLSTGTGFEPPVLWVDHGGSFSDHRWKLGDFNGDGKTDLIVANPGNDYYVSLSTGTGFQPPSLLVDHGGLLAEHQWELGDFNGDGKTDLIVVNPENQYWVSLSTGSSFPASLWMQHGGTLWEHQWQLGDFNGDGKTDLIVANPDNNYYVSLSTGTGFAGSPLWVDHGRTLAEHQWQLGDFNGDGKTDLIVANPENEYWVSLSTGNAFAVSSSGFQASKWVDHSRTLAEHQWQLGDFNGDGLTDLMVVNPENDYWVSLSTGTGFQPDSSGFPSFLWQAHGGSLAEHQWKLGDFNGDGKTDLIVVNPYNDYYVSTTNSVVHDVVTSVANGLGASTGFSYSFITDTSVYTKDTGSVFPYEDQPRAEHPFQPIQRILSVVRQSSSSDGIGGTATTIYNYAGLKFHETAGTSLGFRQTQTTDPAGLVHVTKYNQTLDCTEGTVASSESWANGVRVKYIGNTWTAASLGGGRCYARLASTVEETRELNNSVVATINTNYSGYDSYGQPGMVTVNFNDGWSKTTNNTYNNDTVNWQLGQLQQSQVTANAPGQTAQTRTSSFTYDALGRLATEVIEPNNATLKLTTTYGYNSFGHRVTKTLSGPDIITRVVETLTYDAKGQFVTTRKNALNHTESFTYDPRTGAVMTATDANNITTTFTYNDGFGRKTKESRPGSPTTDIYYECWDGTVPGSGVKCPTPTGSSVTRIRTVTSGSGTNYVFHDTLGRVVQTNTQGFGGNWIYKTTQYDNLGRVTRVAHPYFTGETVHYTTYDYYPDPVGRLWKLTEAGPGNRVTTTTYNGLTTSVTSPPTAASPNGQTKTTVKNSQGLAASVTDNAGTTSYVYDPFGNLKTVTAVDGVVTTMAYDIRGRKTSMTDPDMGSWTYGYNTLGELTRQTDAKNQTLNMTYDVLGRIKTRVLPNGEGTSTWTYDTAPYGKGKLQSASNPNATETYVYDSLSRVSSQTTNVSGVTYTTSYTHDTYSRLLTLTYPTTGFKLYHVYDAYGHLTEVRKDTVTGLRYWKADTFDAHSRLTQETHGNGLISRRAYDHETGDLKTIQTGTSTTPGSIQNSSYTFDALDNLTARTWYDGTTPRSETFGYDTLNRLTTVTGPANKTYAYARNGNITSKTGVGAYSYTGTGCTRPHAICSISGTLNTSFTYDANGNMMSGNGRSYTWTSFNKPKTITKGGVTATYTYGPTGERITQATPTRSVVYVGKLYERETEGGSAKDKSYIYAGANLVALYRQAADGSSYVRYFHTDHLGSVEVVTDEARNVSQRRSFDAFGKNRNVNGTDTTAASDLWFAKRGYTGHEQDDEVGLINMNAREYDYVIGRFISPDTIVPGAGNSQSYNRYSYTNNNPLSYTDPSGHSRLSRKLKHVARVAVGGSFGTANVAGVYAVTHKQDIARFTSGILNKVSGVNYIGGLLSTGLVAGTHFGYVYGASTGDWRTVGQAHKQGAIMAATSYAFNWVGGKYPGFYENIFAHGVVGGTSSVLSGGDFRSGFIGGAFGSLASGLGCKGFMCATISGGIGSKLSGGKFADGAVMSAMGYMFNCSMHEDCMGRPPEEYGQDVVVGDKASKTGLKVLGGLMGAAGGPLVGAGQRGLVALVNSERAIELSMRTWNLMVDTATTGIVAAPAATNFVINAFEPGPSAISGWEDFAGSVVNQVLEPHEWFR